MIFIYFWTYLLATTLAVVVAQRLLSKRCVCLHRALAIAVVGGYLFSTLAHVRLYIHAAVCGNTDAAEGFNLAQALLNPLHFVIPQRLVFWPLGNYPTDALSTNRALDLIPIELWKAIILDVLLGSFFWATVAFLVSRISQRGKA